MGSLLNLSGGSILPNQVKGDDIVDLGLPSGTLWARKNIDITRPDGFAASEYQYDCSFFSWGNTDGHNPTSSSSFSPWTWGSSQSTEPYVSSPAASIPNGNVTFDISYDAARAILGAPWRIPSKEECDELLANCDYVDANGDVISAENKTISISGINGVRLKSKENGNTIFFPCSGYGDGTALNNRGQAAIMRTTKGYGDWKAWVLFFFMKYNQLANNYKRYYGIPIRPIITR